MGLSKVWARQMRTIDRRKLQESARMDWKPPGTVRWLTKGEGWLTKYGERRLRRKVDHPDGT